MYDPPERTKEARDEGEYEFAADGGTLIGLYGRDGLAAEMGVSPEGSGFGGMVFTYVVRSEARVDEILNEAEQAGGTILEPAAATEWGGYGGTFADPDGYVWSIGFSAQAADQAYAE
nr:VOC family protein [Nocardia otitidiscaviarum]